MWGVRGGVPMGCAPCRLPVWGPMWGVRGGVRWGVSGVPMGCVHLASLVGEEFVSAGAAEQLSARVEDVCPLARVAAVGARVAEAEERDDVAHL